MELDIYQLLYKIRYIIEPPPQLLKLVDDVISEYTSKMKLLEAFDYSALEIRKFVY